MRVKGFTIVELLIVIVIISVLAVIATLGFRGVQSRAQETSVTTDMRNISKQLELYRVDQGRYPSASELQTLGIHVNKQTYGVNPTGATIFYCVNNDGSVFSIVARVKSSTLLRYLSSESQVSTYTGSATAPQLCLDSGVPGSANTVSFTPFTENGSWLPWVQG